jgi:glycosyltransferase involved in cell wall biosynthesis
MTYIKTSIILCTRNEEKDIKVSINKLKENIKNLEIIIVDDNSTDQTREIIKSLNKDNKINLIHRIKSKGLASAFYTGLLECKGENVGWIDTNMSELNFKFIEMEDMINQGNDIVVLSRYIKNGSDKRILIRSLSSYIFNFITRTILGSKIKDYTSGIFLMKRSVLKEVSIMPYGHGEFFIEFLENANRKGFLIKEIPFIQKKDVNLTESKTSGNLFKFFYLGFIYFLRVIIIKLRRN